MPRNVLWFGFLAIMVGTTACRKSGKSTDAGDQAATPTVEVPTATATESAEPVPTEPKPAADEPFVPPGACVDVAKDAKRHTSMSWDASVQEIADLDGDGKKDKAVAFIGPGMSYPSEVYVMRGSCGHFVGEVYGNGVKVSGLKSKGLKSVSSRVSNPCNEPCGCVNQEFSYFFNGKQYQSNKGKDVPANDPCDAGAKKVDAGPPTTAGAYKVGDKLMVEWKGVNYPAVVLQVVGKDQYKIHYDNYEAKWDEVVGPARIKAKR